MKNVSITLLVFVFLILNGCASLSKDECIAANWEMIGFEDGANGQSLQRIGQHRKSCAEYGVTPDFEQYTKGHEAGARKYCTKRNGFLLGRKGGKNPNICPVDVEKRFLAGLVLGGEIFELERLVNELEKDRQSLQDEQDEWAYDIAENERMIIKDSTTERLRRDLLEQNKTLKSFINEHEHAKEQLQSEIYDLDMRINKQLRRAGF